eukprot:4764709-Prymnesium_polylepis.1
MRPSSGGGGRWALRSLVAVAVCGEHEVCHLGEDAALLGGQQDKACPCDVLCHRPPRLLQHEVVKRPMVLLRVGKVHEQGAVGAENATRCRCKPTEVGEVVQDVGEDGAKGA